MAKYFIFNKDYANDSGAIVRIAESDDALSKSHINIDLYKVIAVTDDVFSNFRKLVYVSPQYDDSDNITYIDISSTHSFLDEEGVNNEKSHLIYVLDLWLNKNKNHIDYNQWNTFKTNISNIDASSYTYPLVKTVPQLLEDLSQPYYNLLELI
tara:strand:- start:4980 stop:5438 length:459 start_codon:yes stop_codon:yes gene_type:complete